ncbi:MAG: threonine synthase [Chloroflexi bacterium]|nr:threonine synthase [Chloroflexota bacterium]
MRSYLSHLECTSCGVTCSAEEPHRTCPACGKVLYARYDLPHARREVDRRAIASRPATLWRYYELMPVRHEENVVSLGEGMTPLLHARNLGKQLGCPRLYIKDEGGNPTGSFKARGMAAAVSKARELGLRKLTVPSAGNAAGALAAYCAAGGMEAHVFMPRDAPQANQQECLDTGARLTLVDGLIGDAGRLSREQAAKEGLFDLSTLQEPYRAEGKKTMGYELAEQLGWRTPDVIVYPTGGGTGIVGIWKAYQEMLALGWIDAVTTRMVAVQSDGCAPIVRALHAGAGHAEPWQDARTIAAGIRVPSAIGDYLILRAIRESGGAGVMISDQEILAEVKAMASTEGVYPCPEGAATLAGLRRLLKEGALDPEASIVLMNTGTAYKYLDVLSPKRGRRPAGASPPPRAARAPRHVS